ncbi:MAG: PDZ domain-containing protein [Acidobacteriia bacterium]|nr:PDZ domain-containing protein [Terriglobia bacterium]
MRQVIFGLILTAAGLSAQQPPPPPPPLEFFQAPGTARVYELRSGTLGGTSYLGVNLAEINADRARELKLNQAYGVEITRVEDGSPAEKAGLKAGDVVLEYNGQRVEGMEQFGRLVRETPAGREVKVLISRGGATQTISATVGTRKMKTLANVFPGVEIPEIHIPDIPQVFTTLRSPMLGVEAESLGSQLATYFGVKEGVLVRSVLKDTAAEKAGIKAGDVITKVDGSSVTTPNELSSAIRSAGSKKSFTVELVREHREMSVNVVIEDGRSDRAVPGARVVRNAQ